MGIQQKLLAQNHDEFQKKLRQEFQKGLWNAERVVKRIVVDTSGRIQNEILDFMSEATREEIPEGTAAEIAGVRNSF